MKIQKEGLKIYRVEEAVQSEYFLSVEYQTLRLNRPETLLPVLLREKDGERIVLYDITEGKNLMELAEGKGFSWKDCKQFLNCVLLLLEEMEDFMLEMEHVSFEPEYIYRKDEKHFQWMYFPDQSYDVRQEIESFFAWMLSKIDYGDSESVRYIYRVYWSIRNRGFSREMIEECLHYQEEEKEPGITSYEDYFKDKEISEKESEDFSDDIHSKEGKRKKIWLLLMIILLAFLLIDVIIMGYFFVICVQNHFPDAGIRCLVGTAVAFLFLADGVYQFRKIWLEQPSEGTKKEEISAQLREKVGKSSWEDQGKTVILNERKGMPYPALKSMETGEVTGMYTFPFYIGNLSGLNQLLIDDKTVSRKHAVILRGQQPGTYLIRDLQSTNGTWVEEVRLSGDKPVKLEDGSRVCFASQRYQFILMESNS